MLLVPVAAAAVVFERDATRVLPTLEPLDVQASTSRAREWTETARSNATIRSLELALAGFEEPLDTCLAGVPAASTAVTVAVDRRGVASVKAGDDALANCVTVTIGKAVLPIVVAAPVSVKYTVRWDGTAVTRAVTPTPEGFCPEIDRELGFSGVAWGATADTLFEADLTGANENSRLYTRRGDNGGRWLGAAVGVSFVFDAEGLYAVGVSGDESGSFQVREQLVALYGQPKWDAANKSWYWRGNERLLQLIPDTDAGKFVVSLLDIARGRQTGLVQRLPGDAVDPANPETGSRLPKIYSK